MVALATKWDKADLVPGLSDLDYRIICDEDTRADDWIEIRPIYRPDPPGHGLPTPRVEPHQ